MRMARTKHGLPGIYNATPITLSDQEGAALAIDANGRLEVSATIGAVTIDGAYNVTPPSLSDGQLAPVQLDSSGRQYVSTNATVTKTGQVALAAGTAQQLSSVVLYNGVVIKALTANTGTLYVGSDNTVTSSSGYPLANSGEAISFAVSNLNAIWIIGTTGDKVAYAGS